MLCRNGLHEIDSDDPWRGPTGYRCKVCWQAKKASDRAGDSLRGTVRERQLRADPEKEKVRKRLHAREAMKDPVFRQMRNDCKRLGISRAEWRRQVGQGIISTERQ